MNDLRKQARRLNLSNYHSDQIYYDYEQRHNFTDSELCLMYALDDGESHTQKQICEDWHIPKTTLNTIIKQWERLGYLKLCTIPGKRRELLITLTDEGKAYASHLLKDIYHAEEKALQSTLKQYPNYIDATEFYEQALKQAFLESEEMK